MPNEFKDRRVIDEDWKATVGEQFEEGRKKFEVLTTGQDNILKNLAENTTATETLNRKFDLHTTDYRQFKESVQPAVDAIETMQAGVRVLGKIGNAIAWVGNNFRKIVVWTAPIIGVGIAIWQFVVQSRGK